MDAQQAALAGDERSRAAFRDWQAERDPALREAAKARYDAAQAVIEAARTAEVALAQGDTMLFWTRWDKVVAALAAYDEVDK